MTIEPNKVPSGQENHPRAVPKIAGPPTNESPCAVAGEGAHRSGFEAGCNDADNTFEHGAEAALRARVETLFASIHPPLLECLGGLDSTIARIFDRRELRARGQDDDDMLRVEDASPWSPLRPSVRHKIGIALDALLDAAEGAGLGRNAMRDAVYAPVIAADDKERARRGRRAEANERVVTAWNAAIVEAAAIGASPRATLAAAVSAVRRSRSGRPAEKGGRRD